MSKIIIKCFKVNEVWNFYDNVISYEHYFAVLEEKYNELIKKEKEDYYYASSYRSLLRECVDKVRQELEYRNMHVSKYDTGYYILEEREREVEEIVAVDTHIFVKILDRFCLIKKVEVDLAGNVIYYINHTVSLSEKESNNLSGALEKWMEKLYPEIEKFEEMKVYKDSKDERFESFKIAEKKYKDRTEPKIMAHQIKSNPISMEKTYVNSGKTYSDVLREQEKQSENNILALVVGATFFLLFMVMLMLGLGN